MIRMTAWIVAVLFTLSTQSVFAYDQPVEASQKPSTHKMVSAETHSLKVGTVSATTNKNQIPANNEIPAPLNYKADDTNPDQVEGQNLKTIKDIYDNLPTL